MSCYAWEHGTITLPTGQAPVLRKVLMTAAEKRIATLNNDIDKAWNYLKSLTPAKRREVAPWNCKQLENLDDDTLWLLQRHDGAGKHTYARPTQKRIRESVISRHKNHDGSTSTVFRCGEASITLRGNKVEWNVPENNHAPERAWSHPLAVELHQYLERVTWTSRSGGQIVGNDEYSRDSRDAGGGGNYVVREYSAAEQRRRQQARRRSPYSAYWG